MSALGTEVVNCEVCPIISPPCPQVLLTVQSLCRSTVTKSIKGNNSIWLITVWILKGPCVEGLVSDIGHQWEVVEILGDEVTESMHLRGTLGLQMLLFFHYGTPIPHALIRGPKHWCHMTTN